jgi:hypothetical protein
MKQWKNFESDNADDYNDEFEDGLDEDDLDMFEGDDSFEDYGFEENWKLVCARFQAFAVLRYQVPLYYKFI